MVRRIFRGKSPNFNGVSKIIFGNWCLYWLLTHKNLDRCANQISTEREVCAH